MLSAVLSLGAAAGWSAPAAQDQPAPSGQSAAGESAGKNPAESQEPAYETVALQGRVVWLADALRRRYGIRTDADVHSAAVALEGDDGRLWPIVKDNRGRAFHKDPRLRGVPLELLVRRYERSPVVQVIAVYRHRDGAKYEIDYWCDICAIPMYELKECECCQGPIRLRERLVSAESR